MFGSKLIFEIYLPITTRFSLVLLQFIPDSDYTGLRNTGKIISFVCNYYCDMKNA